MDIDFFIRDLLNIKPTLTKKGNTQTSSNNQLFQVILILEKYGFSKLHKNTLPTKKGLYYIVQPNGTQKFPDLLLYNLSSILVKLNFELKKSNTDTIMWNDGFPDKNSLYLFSGKYSCLFTGNSIPEEDRETYNLMCRCIEKLKKKLKEKKTTFTFYPRKAISQKINPSKIKIDLIDVKVMLNKFYDSYESN